MGDDNTGSIARKLGAEVSEMNKSQKSDFVAVQEHINWAIDHATTDWILRIDADEVVTPELKAEIENLLSTDQSPATDVSKVAYGIPRKQYFLGAFLRGGDWAYDRLVRLFQKGTARYEPIVPVHEQFKVQGSIGYLNNALEHYSHPTLNDVLRKFDIYTTLEAEALKMNKGEAFFKMIFLPPYITLRWFFWHKGYVDGFRGLFAGILRGWYDFLVFSKYLKK